MRRHEYRRAPRGRGLLHFVAHSPNNPSTHLLVLLLVLVLLPASAPNANGQQPQIASQRKHPNMASLDLAPVRKETAKAPKQTMDLLSTPGQADGIQLFNPLDLTKEHIPGGSVHVARTAGPRNIAKSKGGLSKVRTSEIPYEQFVVGHFLRYVKRVIHSIMRASLKRTEVANNLHTHIKQEWAQWVQCKTTKKHLLNSIVRFVVYNCPQAKAARVDLVRDFPGWCESEFGLVSSRRGKGKR